MNKLATIALAATLAIGGIGFAPEAKADSCHNLAMSAIDIATYADTSRDADRFLVKMQVYKQMDCANRNSVYASEISEELSLLTRAMDLMCRRGICR
jgi:predicted methyltransferase MtxX (methanogen marker protein 4)